MSSILIVDDNRMNRLLLSRGVEQMGHKVSFAEHGKQAFEMIQANPYELILLDVEMPEMDGFQFAESLRADPRTAGLPVIALCSTASPEAVERGRRVGFYDYVAKFDRQGLIAALKEQADIGHAA